MVRGKVRRPQFNVRLPPDLRRYVEDRAARKWDASEQAIAGLIALEVMSPQNQEELMQAARQAAKGNLPWNDVLAAVSEVKAVEDKRAKRILRMARDRAQQRADQEARRPA